LWRRKVFFDSNIFFPEKVYYEDLATTPRFLAKSKIIATTQSVQYNYLVRGNSITLSTSDKHLLDHLRVFYILYDFLLKEGLEVRYEREFWNAVDNSLHFHAKNVINNNQLSDFFKSEYLMILFTIRPGLEFSVSKMQERVKGGLSEIEEALFYQPGEADVQGRQPKRSRRQSEAPYSLQNLFGKLFTKSAR
jgi:hypothetical protein